MSQPLHAATLCAMLCAALFPAGASFATDTGDVARGRYLIAIGGCNDCHTPGYAQQGEKIPEAARLTGAGLGFSGPWGVSYPTNLRLAAAQTSEDEWQSRARRNGLPPMPWSALQAMSRDDLAAIYRYLRALGPAGEAAPAALAPGQAIPTPHFVFVPQPPTTTKTSSR
ncbi:c-type cytochrome [Zoogloea dura]|nr:c-type cytochrome [Zoogloea dura]